MQLNYHGLRHVPEAHTRGFAHTQYGSLPQRLPSVIGVTHFFLPHRPAQTLPRDSQSAAHWHRSLTHLLRHFLPPHLYPVGHVKWSHPVQALTQVFSHVLPPHRDPLEHFKASQVRQVGPVGFWQVLTCAPGSNWHLRGSAHTQKGSTSQRLVLGMGVTHLLRHSGPAQTFPSVHLRASQVRHVGPVGFWQVLTCAPGTNWHLRGTAHTQYGSVSQRFVLGIGLTHLFLSQGPAQTLCVPVQGVLQAQSPPDA